jgi:hypothetical protein
MDRGKAMIQQHGGHLNVGDIIEIRDKTDGGHFYGLTAECVESDGHDEYPYRCTVRMTDGSIYPNYWPAHYVIISRAK